MDPSNYQVTATLADGSAITIRAIHPDDRQRFAEAFEEFAKSPDSVHFRFHGFKRSLSQNEAIRMTEVDFVDHVALVATRHALGPHQVVKFDGHDQRACTIAANDRAHDNNSGKRCLRLIIFCEPTEDVSQEPRLLLRIPRPERRSTIPKANNHQEVYR